MSSAELRELVADVVSGAESQSGLWATLAELGLTLVGVPAEAGGSGGTVADLAEITRALGAHGVLVPLTERATSAWALASAGHEIVPAATIAVLDETGRRSASAVPWVEGATHLVVVHLADNTVGVLDLSNPAVTIDSSVPFAGVPLTPVTWAESPEPLTGAVDGIAVLARLALLRAVTVAGAAHAAYRLTRHHVRNREQFGRPLVALPAVKTALARMRVQLLQLDTAVAGALGQTDSANRFTSAMTARIVAGSAASQMAQLSHQLHGAIGITREYGLHPLTSSLWAGRDADLPEDAWARMLGQHVLDRGEPELWNITEAQAATA